VPAACSRRAAEERAKNFGGHTSSRQSRANSDFKFQIADRRSEIANREFQISDPKSEIGNFSSFAVLFITENPRRLQAAGTA
jgi:hypothetical protein